MFEMNANPFKIGPKFVFLVPCLVLFAACSSKQIKNASLEPLDLPAEESNTSSYSTPEPEMAAPAPIVPARVKKVKKSKSRKGGNLAAARGSVRKKLARKPVPKPAAAAAVAMTSSELPVIGQSTLNSAPIEMPLIAPPIPPAAIEAQAQPNWALAAFIIGGIVALAALGFRMRRHIGRKRGLIYN